MPRFFRLLYFLARIGSQFDFGHLRYTIAAVAFTFLHMSWSRRLNVYNAYLVVRTSTQNSNDKYQYHQSEPQSGCSQTICRSFGTWLPGHGASTWLTGVGRGKLTIPGPHGSEMRLLANYSIRLLGQLAYARACETTSCTQYVLY